MDGVENEEEQSKFDIVSKDSEYIDEPGIYGLRRSKKEWLQLPWH